MPEYLLDKRVDEVVEAILQLAPEATRRMKTLLRCMPGLSGNDLWKTCTDANAAARLSAEAQEGFRAFLEKRRPSWATLPHVASE
jgi:enoyl-CoA hydratase/carnithine racemase